MKNIKYRNYILPSLVITTALLMSGSQVLAFDGQGSGFGRGMGFKDQEARHEKMSNLTKEERDALRSERQAQREQRLNEKFSQLENAGVDTSSLKTQEAALDTAREEMHNYMVNESENFDKTTLEGRQEFRDATSGVRSSFREKMTAFKDQMKSVFEQYGLSFRGHK